MAIRKRGNSYEADHTTLTGERIRRSFAKRKDAKAYLEKATGQPPTPPQPKKTQPQAASREGFKRRSGMPKPVKTVTSSSPSKRSSRRPGE